MLILKLLLILLFDIPHGDVCVFEPESTGQSYSIELHYTHPSPNAKKIVTKWTDREGEENIFVDFVEEHNVSKMEAFFWAIILERDRRNRAVNDQWQAI